MFLSKLYWNNLFELFIQRGRVSLKIYFIAKLFVGSYPPLITLEIVRLKLSKL